MRNVICLIGNPNCGKTTLFNALTGTYRKVGNFPGVTVESKEGRYRKNKDIIITDLPGLYSFSAGSDDEKAVTDYILKNSPDVIINVVDGTNLERNLNLTCALASLDKPMCIAVNMCDDLEKNGIKLDDKKLSELFGVPVVKISALKGRNIDRLMEVALNEAKVPDIKEYSGTFGKSEGAAYAFIEKHIDKIIKVRQTRAELFTSRADRILMHRIFGIPIFIAVIFLTYYLSSRLGGALGGKITQAAALLSEKTSAAMTARGIHAWTTGLVTDAVIKGLSTVLSFLPQILILFLLLTVIEESGYAARAAFILDRLFRTFGLGGKSMLPLTVSCGCTVTGIMATRIIEDEAEKRMTVFLAPFMPCGAKTAVFGWFSYCFFGGNALISTSMYFLSILCVAVFGRLLKSLKAFGGGSGAFLLEIPTLRFPSFKDIIMVLWTKIKEFLLKAGTIIFSVSVVLWILQNIGINGYTDGNTEESFLFYIGNGIKYIFYPLGFGNWQASVSVVTGILAKEAVIETMTVVSSDARALFDSAYSAYAFMAFVLLSPPCVSALAAARRELKSGKWFVLMILFQSAAGYSVALVINLLGMLQERFSGLILSVVIGIIVLTAAALAFKKNMRSGCGCCGKCSGGVKKCPKK